jgi:hypothetical protein
MRARTCCIVALPTLSPKQAQQPPFPPLRNSFPNSPCAEPSRFGWPRPSAVPNFARSLTVPRPHLAAAFVVQLDLDARPVQLDRRDALHVVEARLGDARLDHVLQRSRRLLRRLRRWPQRALKVKVHLQRAVQRSVAWQSKETTPEGEEGCQCPSPFSCSIIQTSLLVCARAASHCSNPPSEAYVQRDIVC